MKGSILKIMTPEGWREVPIMGELTINTGARARAFLEAPGMPLTGSVSFDLPYTHTRNDGLPRSKARRRRW